MLNSIYQADPKFRGQCVQSYSCGSRANSLQVAVRHGYNDHVIALAKDIVETPLSKSGGKFESPFIRPAETLQLALERCSIEAICALMQVLKFGMDDVIRACLRLMFNGTNAKKQVHENVEGLMNIQPFRGQVNFIFEEKYSGEPVAERDLDEWMGLVKYLVSYGIFPVLDQDFVFRFKGQEYHAMHELEVGMKDALLDSC